MSRITTKSLDERVTALEAGQAEILTAVREIITVTKMLAGEVTPEAPAKGKARKSAPRKGTKKAPRKAAPKAPVKGAQTRETLSRKAWNRTLTAKAKFAGGGAYKRVLDAWPQAQELREKGVTPDEALQVLL